MHPVLLWLALIALDLLLGLALLELLFRWPRRLVNLGRAQRPFWLAATPGHPVSMPRLFTMRYGPWPQPKALNFGAFTPVRISAARPVILRGRANQSRYWGFVFYPGGAEKHTGSLPSIYSPRIELDDRGNYEVVFSPEKSGSNWVYTGQAKGGLISLRNYYPQPGRPVQLPAVYYGDRLMLSAREDDYDA